MPEANVKTNRMEVHNGAITKDGVLPVPTFFFFFTLYFFYFFKVNTTSKEGEGAFSL